MSEFEGPEQRPQRDLSRANWQRGAGAIIMRELTDGIYDEIHTFTADNIEDIWKASIEDLHQYNHEGLSLLWSLAYNTSDFVFINTFTEVDNKLPEIVDRDVENKLKTDFETHTYATTPEGTMREARNTSIHFPISLARSICAHAYYSDKPRQELYKPQTLADIASMIDRPDFRLMVDQAMFAANGFWKGFSTNVNSLATTGFNSEVYNFKDDEFSFSDSSIALLRRTIKLNNLPKSKRFSHFGSSSSGCPAQHLKPSQSALEADDLEWLSKLFDKSPSELVDERKQSVAQEGISYLVKNLKSVSRVFEKKLGWYEAGLKLDSVRMPEDFLTHP